MEPIAFALLLAATPALPAEPDCGRRRMLPQYGYVLDGDVLTLPGGGTHGAEAALLREAYGLVGEGLTLRRTRFVDACGESYTVAAEPLATAPATPAR